jgi:hypothetical protein
MKKIAIVLFCTSLALTNNNVQAINDKEVLQTRIYWTGRFLGGVVAPVLIGGSIAYVKIAYDHATARNKIYDFATTGGFYKWFFTQEEVAQGALKIYLNSGTCAKIMQNHYELGLSCATLALLGWCATKIVAYTTTILSPKGQRLLQRVARAGLFAGLLLMAPRLGYNYRMAQNNRL